MNRIFPEAGPDTTNLRWGIESVILENEGGSVGDLIVKLEKYFIEVVQKSDLQCPGRSSLDTELEFAALEANIRFEE